MLLSQLNFKTTFFFVYELCAFHKCVYSRLSLKFTKFQNYQNILHVFISEPFSSIVSQEREWKYVLLVTTNSGLIDAGHSVLCGIEQAWHIWDCIA